MSEYDEKAEQFLTKTKTEFKAEFLKNGRYFPDDKEMRDIYLITLKRGERSYTFTFGQSIAQSGKYKVYSPNGLKFYNDIKKAKKEHLFEGCERNKEFKEPSAYEVLAALTKYEPGTLKDFCDSYGYDEDSKKAEQIYKNVVDEWRNIQILYNDDEISELQEIN